MRIGYRSLAGLIGVAVLIAGCASNGPILAPHMPEQSGVAVHELARTPFFAQEDYQCGPAALATVLNESGVDTSLAELVPQVYLPEKKGSLQLELIAASRRHARVPYVIDRSLSALLAELRARRPVLVLQNLGFDFSPVWHYAVVVGFDSIRDELVLRSGRTKRKVISASRFLKTWERADEWALVVLRPDELPASPEHGAYLRSVAALEAAGQPRAAARAYQRALNRWPESDVAMLGLGNAYYADGEAQKAEAMYRRLLATHPGHGAASNNLAQVLSERGCNDAALAAIDGALAHGQKDNLRAMMARTRATILSHSANIPEASRRCPASL